MEDPSATIASGLADHYAALAERVYKLAGPLSEEQFWTKPFPFGNSFGHLVLHVTGNLKYYIGAQIAGTGYVRDRDREFTEAHPPSKAEALKRFDEAIDMVISTVRRQSASDWSAAYTAQRAENAGNRFNILLKCATHLDHHVGQMNYLCQELTR
jgi:uncharacterized damage-inducible protein DinB